jgi:osmoprotectant transport system ATP-binding protein
MMQLFGVTKRYGDREVLRGVTLDLLPNRTTVLLGPSGCGKSTILRLLLRLLVPDRGRIAIDGEDLATADVLQLRRRVGYVIQDGGLFPHRTAEGNITLMARYLGWEPQRIKDRLKSLVALTKLPADALGRYPRQLSGGQRQRVALMRALMLDPAALLLDEPLGALDPLIRAELQEDLRAIFRSLGKTVVLVTHDLGEADYFADHIVLMEEGRVVQQGTLAELWRAPATPFVRHFIQAQRGPRLPEGATP